MVPPDIKALLQTALEHLHSGREKEAVVLLRDILKANKKQPDALQLLGHVAHSSRNFDVARDLYLKSLEAAPGQHAVWANYGRVLFDLRQVEDAEKAMMKALEIKPDFAEAFRHLANFALSRGDKDQAATFAAKALEINPDKVTAYLSLARARTIAPDEPMVAKMHDLLAQFEGQRERCGNLHFALSNVYEAAGETEKFLHHLGLANESVHEPHEADRAEVQEKFNIIKETMTPEFLARKVGIEEKIYTPVFIVGMPRSGTTLLDQVFATHSQCFGGDELHYFSKYLNRMSAAKTDLKGEAGYKHLKPEHLSQVARLYQLRVHELAPDALFISDKMLWNFQLIGIISVILPWAKIIHIHRDPLDCGWSTYRNPLQTGIWFGTDMEAYAWYRKQYQDLMDFWQATTPESFINVAYEDLVANPEAELKRIVDYCGLGWEDELLQFHKTKREVHTLSSGQVNQPIHRKSVGAAEKYAEYLEPMKRALEKYKVI